MARVDTYKYVGIVLNNRLSWGDHMDFIVNKYNSRIYCLRKLNTSTIVSVWRYCLTCCGGNVSKSEKRRIDSIVREAERVIGECQSSVDSVYLVLLRGELEMLWSDNSHPLHGQIVTMPLSYRKPPNCIIVMLADDVRPLNWGDSLHYHCYV